MLSLIEYAHIILPVSAVEDFVSGVGRLDLQRGSEKMQPSTPVRLFAHA